MANLNAMKNNDLKALMLANMTPEEYERAKTEWTNKKTTFSDADKARFAATMQMLTSEGAEDQIMALVEPQLQQVQAMLPMMFLGKPLEQKMKMVKKNGRWISAPTPMLGEPPVPPQPESLPKTQP